MKLVDLLQTLREQTPALEAQLAEAVELAKGLEGKLDALKAKVAKHRNGPIGEVPLQFRKSNTRFYTMTREVEVQAY